MTKMYDDVFVQAQGQEARQSVYQLDKALFYSYPEQLKAIGTPLVAGFMQQIDAEKDPRCLMIVFELVPYVAQHFPLGKLSSELFDIAACYFPITFNPPKNDPYGVTKEGLVGGLRACMHAHPSFAEPCLKLLLDKASSTINDTKVECFASLKEAFENFYLADVWPFQRKIYQAIRTELFQNIDQEVQQAALSAFGALLLLLKPSSLVQQGGAQSHLHEFMEPVLTEAVRHLADIDMGIISLHGKLLVAACGTCASAASLVLDSYLDPATNQYRSGAEAEQQRAIADVLSGMTQATVECCKRDPAAKELLRKHNQTLFHQFCQSCQGDDEQLQQAGLRGLTSLLRAELCDEAHASMAADIIKNHCQQYTPSRFSPLETALTAAKTLGAHYPSVFTASLLHPLMASAASPSPLAQFILQALPDAAVQGGLNIAQPVLTALLQQLQQADSLDSHRHANDTARAVKAIVEGYPDADIMVELILQPIMQQTLQCKHAQHGLRNASVVAHLAEAVSCCVRVCSTAVQTKQRDFMLALFQLQQPNARLQDQPEELHCTLTNPESHCLLPYFKAVLASLNSDVTPTLGSHSSVIESLTTAVQDGGADDYGQHLAATLAALINKHSDDEAMMAYVKQRAAAEPTCDHDKVLLLYLTKAVVMRGYKHQKTMTAAYFKALASDESDILSNGIGLILDDATWWLCRASHGQARLMYKQRFFQENLATLLEGYKQANSSDVQRKYMTAVGHMLQNVPETVLAAHFDQVLPIVLASLSGEDQTAAQASLKLLASMLESSPDLLEPHAGSLIKSGLALTMAPNTLHVRQQALRCLTQLAYSLDATKVPVNDSRSRLYDVACCCAELVFASALPSFDECCIHVCTIVAHAIHQECYQEAHRSIGRSQAACASSSS
eukprot:TRINITY_DN9871_c0_g1_i3.p1 TRINITY_DN9871_c0_g1~~TRINITY_DN9871_c0_g1_i3.p1  ORF type:complete len:1010 (+),score=284.63 TRINITY_DN9871_c0_g1_i3:333-3032(+)